MNHKATRDKTIKQNLIKGINTLAVLFVNYSGLFLKWTCEELKQMDQRGKKLITMHPRDDVDRLNESRKEGGGGFTSIEDSVDASIQRLEDYIEKRRERQITATRKILTTRRPTERKKTESKNGKQNNSMDVLRD